MNLASYKGLPAVHFILTVTLKSLNAQKGHRVFCGAAAVKLFCPNLFDFISGLGASFVLYKDGPKGL
jgi:hypothetical protein